MNDAGPAHAVTFDRRAIPAQAVETRFTLADGHMLRRIDWLMPAGTPRGSMLFMPGRGDFYEKYLETLDYWHCHGWRVTAADWRGQAGSGRLGLDGVTGHVPDFSLWVSDLADVWRRSAATGPGPRVLVAHSMGGHIALRAVAEGALRVDAVVLVAPMLGFLPQWMPARLLHLAARGMVRLGDPRRAAWRKSEKPAVLPADRARLLTHDAGRYADEEWWRATRPQLAMGTASWGWVERALASMRLLERPGVLEGVTAPVLILAAERDGLVSMAAIRRAARRMPRAQLHAFGGESRHEILREEDRVRDRALAAIDDFLDRMAPRED
ncbi:MAG: alpha/beta hydrolase [Novosphingobium sp.]|nr:alpha/beta hydrolase [Novosphingobium sp.]